MFKKTFNNWATQVGFHNSHENEGIRIIDIVWKDAE